MFTSHLDNLINSFLKHHRESDDGWAEITPEDMSLLWDIIRELIKLKCSQDADGDLPIEFKLVNRMTHENLQFDPVPYREEVSHEQIMRILMRNLNIAHNRLDSEYRIQQNKG